eukprot:scaffold4990_cov387-Prasinococcus_capsulatus_cf.AAC.46
MAAAAGIEALASRRCQRGGATARAELVRGGPPRLRICVRRAHSDRGARSKHSPCHAGTYAGSPARRRSRPAGRAAPPHALRLAAWVDRGNKPGLRWASAREAAAASVLDP